MIKVWHVDVTEGEEGALFLDLHEHLDELGWEIGDTLIWIQKPDGTVTIQKKPAGRDA